MNPVFDSLLDNIETVIKGQTATLKLLLAGFFSGGHILLEDMPGTGKTTLAKALAKSIDIEFQRVQFTPDLLPGDISGVNIFNQKEQDFSFQPGPIFTNILLADEINRASPRTQSALLEAMEEHQISLDRETHPLPAPFFVIATQNPVECHGTWPLPESQMDRFSLCLRPGHVDRDTEFAIAMEQQRHSPLDNLSACMDKTQVILAMETVRKIYLSDEVRHYAVDVVRATRELPGVRLGASIRATLNLIRCCQALAWCSGQDFVTPEQVQQLAIPVLAHRLLLTDRQQAGKHAQHLITRILNQIPVPE